MTIYINENPLDFTLENEENLGQVLTGIEKWLDESNMGITEIGIDGEECLLSQRREWREKPLNDIETLKLTVFSNTEIEAGKIQTLFDYFDILKRALTTDPPADLTEILGEFPYVRASFPALMGEMSLAQEQILDPLEEALQKSGAFENGRIQPEEIPGLTEKITMILTIINNRLREILYPREELQNTLTLMTNLLPRVSEISILLQTGQDKDAMALVIHLSELFSRFTRIITDLHNRGSLNLNTITIEEESFSAFNQDLNNMLNELVEAFQAEDTVLMGDLLEYEIVPRLEKLPLVLQQIDLQGDQ